MVFVCPSVSQSQPGRTIREREKCEATVYFDLLDCVLVPGGVRGGLPPRSSARLLLRFERGGGEGGPVARVGVAVAGVVVAGSVEVRRPPADLAASAALQAVAAPGTHLEGRGAVAGLVRRGHGLDINPLHLHLLLVFHPPVLEPDLDLPLRQAEHGSHLNPPKHRSSDYPSF